jgi:hypothetical protein
MVYARATRQEFEVVCRLVLASHRFAHGELTPRESGDKRARGVRRLEAATAWRVPSACGWRRTSSHNCFSSTFGVGGRHTDLLRIFYGSPKEFR